jgi:ArsR family transcriptional regulator
MNMDEARAQARIMKALANPVRLMIVEELSRGDRCVCELSPLFSLDLSTLSRHLATLKHAGIVTERRAGVKIIHHLATPCVLKTFNCCLNVIKANARRARRPM